MNSGSEPFSLRDIGKDTFLTYKNHIKSILLLCLLVILPLSLVQVFLIDPSFEVKDLNAILGEAESFSALLENEGTLTDLQLSQLTRYFYYRAVYFVLSLLAVVLQLAVIKITYYSHQQIPYQLFDVFEESVRLFPKALVTCLMMYCVVFCGLLFFIFPGIFAAIILYFAVYAVAVTGLGGPKALTFSSLISRGKVLKILLLIIGLAVFRTAYTYLLGFLFGLIPLHSAATVLYQFSDNLISCLTFIFCTKYFLHIMGSVDIAIFRKKNGPDTARRPER